MSDVQEPRGWRNRGHGRSRYLDKYEKGEGWAKQTELVRKYLVLGQRV